MAKVQQPTSYAAFTALLAGLLLLVSTFFPLSAIDPSFADAVARDRDILDVLLETSRDDIDTVELEALVSKRLAISDQKPVAGFATEDGVDIGVVMADLLKLFDIDAVARGENPPQWSNENARALLKNFDQVASGPRVLTMMWMAAELQGASRQHITDTGRARYQFVYYTSVGVLGLAVLCIVLPVFSGFKRLNPIFTAVVGLAGTVACAVIALSIAQGLSGAVSIPGAVPFDAADVGVGGWIVFGGAFAAIAAAFGNLKKETLWIAVVLYVAAVGGLGYYYYSHMPKPTPTESPAVFAPDSVPDGSGETDRA